MLLTDFTYKVKIMNETWKVKRFLSLNSWNPHIHSILSWLRLFSLALWAYFISQSALDYFFPFQQDLGTTPSPQVSSCLQRVSHGLQQQLWAVGWQMRRPAVSRKLFLRAAFFSMDPPPGTKLRQLFMLLCFFIVRGSCSLQALPPPEKDCWKVPS